MSRCPASDAARPQAHAPTSPMRVSHKPPRRRPADLYPLPAGEGRELLGSGLRRSYMELREMDAAALAWDLRRVRRALAAFTPAERRSEYGTPEFDGSRRNPIVLWTSAYPYLFSDWLQEREWAILREIRRREEEVAP